MGYTKQKKAKLFLEVGGKCEYCRCDMVLCFANYCNIENLATFDHLYNRDHELRQSENDEREKRIFLVCKKCNNERSRAEPNNQQRNGLEKTVKKLVPKEVWSNEKFMEKIAAAIADEVEISKQISDVDKQMNHLKHQKTTWTIRLSKKAKYRNFLIQHLNEQMSNRETDVQASVATEAK